MARFITALPVYYFVGVVMRRLRNAKPRQKLIYVGLLTTVQFILRNGDIPTIKQVADLYGLDYTTTSRFFKTLVDAGILKTGRTQAAKTGRTLTFVFAETAELRICLGLSLTAIEEPSGLRSYFPPCA